MLPKADIYLPFLVCWIGVLPLPSTLQLEIGQYSAAGRKAVNQDAMAARVAKGFEQTVKGTVLAVADGISSSPRSQVASEVTVTTLLEDYFATPQAWTVKTSARRVIESLNSWLFAQNRHARTSDLNQGLVCTLTALVLKGHHAHIFHVGDSRVSQVVGTSIEPLTEDHVSYVSENRTLLARAIGAQAQIEIDYLCVDLKPGDVFLMTTDGVHEHITGADVADALTLEDLDLACQQLAEKALAAGSIDNLTAQLVRIVALPDELPRVDDSALPIPHDVAPGARIDGLEVLKELHHSSRSRVLLARQADGASVVMKIPALETGQDPSYLQRFLFEEWVARRINSNHLVKAAAERTRSASYVALEYVEGMTLRQWMLDHPQAELETVRKIIEQLASGLRALHRLEMIHQDLRPENVMIDRHGAIKIIDLGSVAVPGLAEAMPGLLGTMPGTFQYTAPEYLSGESVTWRVDQYALGVIAYEMLTGELPYGTQVAKVRTRTDQKRLRYRDADTSENGIPEWLNFALATACHRDSHRRYDALSEFVADLRRPSSRFKPRSKQPLLESHPVGVWQAVATLQLLIILWLLASS